MLPPGWTSMTLRHINFRGERYDIQIKRDAQGKVTLTRHAP
jgi:hypothetical protein